MKTPNACTGLDDIREAIDHLDWQILQLMGERMNYVKAASAFKPDLASIPAPDRVARMLAQRREWAVDTGLEPQFVAEIYQVIIEGFIGQQVAYWKRMRA
ncbi:isochorismate lyase [Pseudomonas putida]